MPKQPKPTAPSGKKPPAPSVKRRSVRSFSSMVEILKSRMRQQADAEQRRRAPKKRRIAGAGA
jgi:hypothetical protein